MSLLNLHEKCCVNTQNFVRQVQESGIAPSYLEFNLSHSCISHYKGQIRKAQKAETVVAVKCDSGSKTIGERNQKSTAMSGNCDGSMWTVVLLQLLLLMG